MGWLKFGSQRPSRTDYEQFLKRDEVAQVEEVEFPFCSKDIGNENLPFISAEIVKSKDGKEGSKLCVSAASHLEILFDADHIRDRDRRYCL